MALWRHLADRAPSGSAVLDIGAYHGMYAIAARDRRPDLAIYAFEPNASELDVLAVACRDRQIEVVPKAVAEHTGSVTFSVDGESSGIVEQIGDRVGTSVDAIALDDWALVLGLTVGLMKVDVEGGEADVFTGGVQLMERHAPSSCARC